MPDLSLSWPVDRDFDTVNRWFDYRFHSMLVDLPDAFAHDADHIARVEREARVLAALNHPNIAAIYGIEEHALVMELGEGRTLAERISQGPL